MKFATFNLYQFLEPGNWWYEKTAQNTYSQALWDQKTGWIQDTLRAIDADVVGFQEVFSKNALQALCNAAGFEHFAVVGRAGQDEQDPQVFTRPVVALASKHPIVSLSEVGVSGEVAANLPLANGFAFSRTPIKAVLNTPEFGLIQVYVTHLKSKRPLYQTQYSPADDLEDKVFEEVLGQAQGKIAALLQRGAEAALLAADVAKDQRYSKMPSVVLGDMNCDYTSVEYDALSPSNYMPDIPKANGSEEDRHAVKAYANQLWLDSSYLRAEQKDNAPTYYYHGKGSSLDYIFLTESFLNAGGRVARHQVWDDHLLDRDTGKPHGNQAQKKVSSDHAIVSVEIIAG
ncbi:endonuclease/exonuclease/phosphatase family protein [Photobacterium sp. 1_MG-2023]|uniref:endonuclease/exonuclease/phosphatase family protein n=1 Tax=Photobacterium sp. 1_MG-2023 TaxID=3062646 RepID=UPI0026E1C5BF|nr:endonuclease/exonuclease/phosphatase family protein [Photobacterium sp. 1_MG-2023]MDO6708323.1 endonuclease/exonuclease/phosphatase family protein [Photobacterium sp. 1_MG-2023]